MLYIEKIVSLLAYPLDLSLLLALIAGLLLWRGWQRTGLLALAFAIAWLWGWSLPVASDAFRLTLESGFQDKAVAQLPHAQAIVVLGGGTMPSDRPRFPYPNLGAASDRTWEAARLFHADKAPLVIASGGRVPWLGKGPPEAAAMRKFLLALGVPAKAIVMETHSLSTHENAVDVKPILDHRSIHHILLVTSAWHMQRALATFHAAGINATPAPTDFDVRPEPNTLLRWLPDAKALERSSQSIKEYVGLAYYRLRGWAAATPPRN